MKCYYYYQEHYIKLHSICMTQKENTVQTLTAKKLVYTEITQKSALKKTYRKI